MSRVINRSHVKGVLADGTPVIVNLHGCVLPSTVWVDPTNGDTITVEYRTDEAATWKAWPNGAATAFSSDVLDSPVSDLRFTRSAGSGATSRYGVR